MKIGSRAPANDSTRAFALLVIALAKGAEVSKKRRPTKPKPSAPLSIESSHTTETPYKPEGKSNTMSLPCSSSLKKARSSLLVGLFGAALLAGCTTTDPYSGEQKVSHTTKDAGIGAVAGAVLGAATSGKHDRGRGALIGAAIGGGVGAAVGHHTDKQEAELRKKLENSGVEVQREGNTINLVVPSAISFATNSAQLTSNFYDPLNKVATSLKEYGDTTVQIIGHTDSTGNAAYNQQLSVNRANAVVVYLSAQGVDQSRMQAVGMGPSQPIADNNTAEGRAQNRRVEIKIIPHDDPNNNVSRN